MLDNQEIGDYNEVYDSPKKPTSSEAQQDIVNNGIKSDSKVAAVVNEGGAKSESDRN